MGRENDLKRNASGYVDFTAYEAIKAADKDIEGETRFKKLLTAIFIICDLAGYHIENRLEIRDKRTGKVWR